MPYLPTRLALCLAAALALTACAEDKAPTADELIERAAGMETPTDASVPPLELAPASDEKDGGEAEMADTPAPATPAVTTPPPPAVAETTPPVPTPAPATPAPTPPAPQPETDGTAAQAEAAELWSAFRRAVVARDGSAIETLIANPVRLNGQMVPHAEFAEMTPGGSVSDFITTFEGELSTSDELTPAADGGYQALATARAEDTESALVFRLAPDADGTWRIVAIDLAG